jgi:hypothetical protein
MSKMTEDQMDALVGLVGALELSPVVKTASSVDTTVPATIARPIRSARFSGSMAEPKASGWSGWSKGGKKSRKMRGGGKCEDNWYVNMAVNSAIVMSGTAAALGAGYGGYIALVHFMDAFGLDEAVQNSIEAIYQAGMAIGQTVGTAGASAVSGAMDVVGSAVSGLKSAAPAFGKAAGSVAYTGAMAGPLVALGRYVGTEQSARDDLQAILSGLESQYTGLNDKIGTVTRSMAAKKEQYASQIHDVRSKIDEYNNNAQAVAAVAKKNTTNNFNSLKRALCDAIDKRVTNAKDIENIFNPYYGMNMDIAFGGKRRRRGRSVRGSKSSKSRSNSKSSKSGKKSKKMKSKRGKKSVKRRSSKR